MQFQAQVINSSLFVRIVQCIERQSKTAVLMLTPTWLHIIMVSDTEGGLQMWSDVDPQALFASYRVESLHNNKIHLEFHIDNLQRVLRSAHSSQSAVLKLTKVCRAPDTPHYCAKTFPCKC